jgi:hypothetical protein
MGLSGGKKIVEILLKDVNIKLRFHHAYSLIQFNIHPWEAILA